MGFRDVLEYIALVVLLRVMYTQLKYGNMRGRWRWNSATRSGTPVKYWSFIALEVFMVAATVWQIHWG